MGVITSPGRTFAAVAAGPRWVDVLLLTTAVTFACSAVLLQTEVGRLALVDQWERLAVGFGRRIGDAEYGRLHEMSRQGIAYAAASALMSGPVLTVLIAGLVSVAGRIRVPFRQLLAVVAHAGVILALRELIATPLQYVTETLASPTTLIRLAGSFDEADPVARFLGTVDLFVIWWAVVLAIGVGAVAHISARRLALTFAGLYVAVAMLLAVAMALTGGSA
jgi:hypothetical protein